MDDYDDFNSTRTRWLKAAVIGLGAVVAAAAAFGVGRRSAPAPSSAQRSTVSGQSGPGPWRVENGVPVGYAHTPDGAVAAATNYDMVIAGPLITQPNEYRAAIDTLAASESKAALRADAEKSFTAFQTVMGLSTAEQQGRSIVFRTVPLSYHIDHYSNENAQISIWAESMAAIDGTRALSSTWSTASYTVEWQANDWKLAASATGDSGPSPITGQPSATTQFPPQLKEYKAYSYASSA